MTIAAILSYCDECRKDMEGGELVFCSTCCSKLTEKIASLKDKIFSLEYEIIVLKKEKK